MPPPQPRVEIEEIFRFAADFRAAVEPCWDDETRHPEMKPVPNGRPNSYGQCWQSSIVLLGELEEKFPGEPFELVKGSVMKLGSTALYNIIDYHAWVNWKLPGHNAHLVDVTGDQAGDITLLPVTVNRYADLAEEGIVYITTGSYGDLCEATRMLSKKELGRHLLDQAAVLGQRYRDVRRF